MVHCNSHKWRSRAEGEAANSIWENQTMQRRFLVGALAVAAAGSILLTRCGEKKDNAVILGVTAGSSE